MSKYVYELYDEEIEALKNEIEELKSELAGVRLLLIDQSEQSWTLSKA